MGYRSDVSSAVYFADHAHLIESIVKYEEHVNQGGLTSVLGIGDDDELSGRVKRVELEGRRGYTLNVADWKWYRGYSSVDRWEDFLRFMGMECDACTVFIRAGEDASDNEFEIYQSTLGSFGTFSLWDHYGIERRIVSPHI